MLHFELPDEPDWSTDFGGEPQQFWDLLVEADVPGVDFKASFPIPVYTGGQSASRR